MKRKGLSLVVCTALLTGCGRPDAADDAVIAVEGVGFATPESVLHDPQADLYIVSNINGSPLGQDGNGFISRLSPSGDVLELKWIDGTAEGVTLHAPKGMGIAGDTLFVADINHVRLFHRVSGAPLGERAVPGATFLNDIAVGPDGTVYVTDTGLRAGPDGFRDSGTDALYRFDDDRAVAIATGAGLGRPNGIVVAPDGVIVVTFGSGTVYRIDPATGQRTNMPIPDQGQLDGVIRLSDGTLLISSWAAQAIYRLSPEGRYEVLVENVPAPADIGYDRGRRRVLIPLFMDDKVLIHPI